MEISQHKGRTQGGFGG